MSLRDSAIVAYAETKVMDISDRDVWEEVVILIDQADIGRIHSAEA